MLILSRKLGEKIIIGDGPTAVHVTVTVIRGDVVKLGIDAPKDITVHRSEVYARINACPELCTRNERTSDSGT